MNERTFVMIKPDSVDDAESILEELDGVGNRISTSKVESLERTLMEEHYSCYVGEPHFRPVVEYFTGQTVVVAVYEGDGIIQKIRNLIGATDPAKAQPSTIRARYSDDSAERARQEGRPHLIRNVIHASDSPSQAKIEIDVWRTILNLQDK